MSQIRRDIIKVLKSDGTPVLYEDGKGYTLANGTVYYAQLADADGPWEALSIKWDGSIIFTGIQFEESNFPRYLNDAGSGTDDVTDVSTTNGNWIVWPLPAANVSVIATDASTGGATYTAATGVLAVAGGTAGGARVNLVDVGSRRGRIKMTVGGTGGVVRLAHNRKS